MEMYKKIRPEEMDVMYWMIKTYGASCYGDTINPNPDMEHRLRFWLQNKQALYRLLGNELITTEKILINKPIEILNDEIYKELRGRHGAGYTFSDAFNSFIYDYAYEYRYEPIGEVAQDAWLSRRHNVSEVAKLISNTCLASNVYDGETVELVLPNQKEVLKINTGCKASKMLGKIATAYNLPGYENFRIAHSMILNQKMLKGDLCFSIHPLDYFTMSDNNCNWDSCMSWTGHGDYRMGTVEMMNSSYVVVAYLKSETDMEFEDNKEMKWNNKKWRQLFIVHPDIILAIKGYPYQNDELAAVCLKYLKGRAEKNLQWGPYTENLNKMTNLVNNNVGELNARVHMNLYTNYMYNDIYDTHDAYVSTDILITEIGKVNHGRIEFCYSGEAECMECGARIFQCEEVEPQDLICDECNPYVHCQECGERIYREDGHHVDGYTLCEYCYDRAVNECVMCGELHMSDRVHNIYLAAGGELTQHTTLICDECYDTMKSWLSTGFTDYHRGWTYRETARLEDFAPAYYDKVREYFEIEDDEWAELISNVPEADRASLLEWVRSWKR